MVSRVLALAYMKPWVPGPHKPDQFIISALRRGRQKDQNLKTLLVAWATRGPETNKVN